MAGGFHPVKADRSGQALDGPKADVDCSDGSSEESVRGSADCNGIGLRERLETSCYVRRFAEGQGLPRASLTDRAHHHGAGMNADSNGERESAITLQRHIELGQAFDDGETRSDRPTRIVFPGDWIA